MLLHRLCLPAVIVGFSVIKSAAAATSKLPLNLLSVVDAGGETNGCGDPGTSALVSSIIVTGDDTPVGCGDDTLWTRFVKSDGTAKEKLEEEEEYEDLPNPQQLGPNTMTEMVASFGVAPVWRDETRVKIAIRTIKPDSTKYKTYEQEDTKKPIAISMLNNGNVAMIHEESQKVGIYKLKDNGEVTMVSDVKLNDGDMPLKTVKKMIYDPAANALFIAGNVSGGKRGLARVDVGNGDGKLAWVKSVNAKVGTPALHLRRKSLKTEATEVLLLSRSFYARVDASDGSEKFVETADDGEYLSWLPEGVTPRAAYDPIRDVIYTTGDTRLREHNIKTGSVVAEEEFYLDPPSSWDIRIKDNNPMTDLSKYPPFCGPGPYPDHPKVKDNKWKGIDDEDDCQRNENDCPYDTRNEDCSDSDNICCVNNDCCILDSWGFFNNWRRVPSNDFPDGADAKAVYVTADGRINVVIVFSGYVLDEDDYYQTSVATFEYTGSSDNNGDSGDDDDDDDDEDTNKCIDMKSKSKCREMVTSTGCYWSRTKGCIKANKCSKIKNNKSACLKSTAHGECVYLMKKEGKYVCNDRAKSCSIAKTKAACQYNDEFKSCSWSSSKSVCK
mmetsp:Transcript_6757/g.14768  ORF Transcript_6757/g.14768 Transcript_6757/m.14768 type:complete len:611 (+) Transcript_6757:126-1958(+)